MDTQSRFAVNTARSIVCVGTHSQTQRRPSTPSFNAARSIVCVGTSIFARDGWLFWSFNAARSIVCVGTRKTCQQRCAFERFNAARSIVCVGTHYDQISRLRPPVSMPHAALCVSGLLLATMTITYSMFQCRTQHCVCRDKFFILFTKGGESFNAARSIVCVGTQSSRRPYSALTVSMPHAALCVSGLCVPQPLSHAG